MKHKKGNHNLILMYIVIGLFFLMSIACWMLFAYFAPTRTTGISKSTLKDPIKTIYSRAKNLSKPNTYFEITPEHIWWITKDGYNIYIPTTDVLSYNIKSLSTQSNDILSDSNVKTFVTIATSTLEHQGFQKNTANSSTSTTDEQFYDYIQAYEKNSTKCTITVSPDFSGPTQEDMHYSSSIACTDDFDKVYNKQIPILRSLGIKDAVISGIQKQSGDFYWFNINYRRTGHYTIAKKRRQYV